MQDLLGKLDPLDILRYQNLYYTQGSTFSSAIIQR